MKANHTDYIIKGIKGEIYPCKQDIFRMTYDEINMDMLVLKVDKISSNGDVLLKANTPYMSKSEEILNGKRYLVYDSEIENQEVLLPIN
jgi:hypothetical protein